MQKDESLEIVNRISRGIAQAKKKLPQKYQVHKIEPVPSFTIHKDRELSLWVFHKKIQDVLNQKDQKSKIQGVISDCFLSADVPADIVKKIHWIYDSDEMVQKKTDGNYFYYLR